jgi:hypothetical protein
VSFRKTVNLVLQKRGYRVVKMVPTGISSPLLPGQIEDNDCLAAQVCTQRKHAWIVAAPKSGSTWLSRLLRELLGWPEVSLVNGYHRREQEVDIRPLLRYPKGNVFSPHQHCRASEPTMDFIKKFGVKPIIQTRNIFDTVVSLRDHLFKESLDWPMAFVDEGFFRLDEEKQYQFIIEMFLPWYFNFYVSWFRADGLEPSGMLFVRYEDLVKDPSEILGKVLLFLDETRAPAEINEAITRAGSRGTRLNKGVSGRGNQLLNERHKAKIREMRQYYSHIDFSMVGL